MKGYRKSNRSIDDDDDDGSEDNEEDSGKRRARNKHAAKVVVQPRPAYRVKDDGMVRGSSSSQYHHHRKGGYSSSSSSSSSSSPSPWRVGNGPSGYQQSPPKAKKKKNERIRDHDRPNPVQPPPPPLPTHGGGSEVFQYDYSDAIAHLLEEETREEQKRRRTVDTPLFERHEYYSKEVARRVGRVDGDKKLKDLRRCLVRLDQMGFRRTNHQITFHEAFIAACISQIYQDDLQRNLVRILEENNFSELNSEIAVVCPRRWGKTMAVAIFVASFIFTQPGAEVCIYSVAKRASLMLLMKVYAMVRRLCDDDSHFKSIVMSFNQEEFKIQTINGGVGLVRSYPSNSKVGALFPSPSHHHHHHTKARPCDWPPMVPFPFLCSRRPNGEKNKNLHSLSSI